LLIIDRFDIDTEGRRLGFEDVASLMGLRVRDSLSDRKYYGSYESIADVFRMIGLSGPDLARFYEQVAFSVMVRNGDAHLKNFGVLYTGLSDVRLAPMFDVVTTSVYKYTRYEGGPEMEDTTMALKLFKGAGTKTYPVTEELLDCGRRVCNVVHPHHALERIAEGMQKSLNDAIRDSRVPADALTRMRDAWDSGINMGMSASRVMASMGSGAFKPQRKRRAP